MKSTNIFNDNSLIETRKNTNQLEEYFFNTRFVKELSNIYKLVFEQAVNKVLIQLHLPTLINNSINREYIQYVEVVNEILDKYNKKIEINNEDALCMLLSYISDNYFKIDGNLSTYLISLIQVTPNIIDMLSIESKGILENFYSYYEKDTMYKIPNFKNFIIDYTDRFQEIVASIHRSKKTDVLQIRELTNLVFYKHNWMYVYNRGLTDTGNEVILLENPN